MPNRIISISISAGLLAIIGIPFLDGYLLKQRYMELIEVIESGADGAVHLELTDYRLGWRTSTAKLSVNVLNKQTGKFDSPPIQLDETIQHGPIFISGLTNKLQFAMGAIKTEIHLPPVFQAMLNTQDKSQAFVTFYTVAGFRNLWSQTMTVLPVSIPGVGSFNMLNSLVNYQFQLNNHQIISSQTEGFLGGITINSMQPRMPNISVQPIQFSQSSQLGSNQLYDIYSHLDTAGISASFADQRNFSLNELKASSALTQTESRFYNLEINKSISEISYNNQIIPEPLQFHFSIAHLNALKFNNVMNELKAHGESLANNNNQEKLYNDALNLLTPTTGSKLQVHINTTMGKFEAEVNSNLSKTADPTQVTLNDLQQNFHLDGKLTIAKPLLLFLYDMPYKQMDGGRLFNAATVPASTAYPPQNNDMTVTIESLVQSGALKDDGDHYSVNVLITGTNATINGKPATEISQELNKSQQPATPEVLPNTAPLTPSNTTVTPSPDTVNTTAPALQPAPTSPESTSTTVTAPQPQQPAPSAPVDNGNKPTSN